jgi:glycosyltransferase involved in cell wall biosynthesis
MTPPLASVAVPAYNHARYIGACLESVRSQSYPELELMVVDDGSSDGTGEVVQRFIQEHGSRFRRVELIRQDNRGVSAASNRAIAACRGEWVHLLGSDDLLYPHKVEAQWRAIQDWGDERLVLVYADADLVDEDGTAIPKIAGARPPAGPDPQAYLSLVLGNPIPNPTVALHRERFVSMGGFDESRQLEDWDCWLRLATRYALARVPERLAAYRRHGANASLRQAMMLQESWIILGRFFERHGELIPPALARASFRRRLRSFRRWARSNAPVLLPGILWDTVRAWVRAPEPAWFDRYASLCDTRN